MPHRGTASAQITPAHHAMRWRAARGRELALDHPRFMAILNVTPDSFSDGGELPTPDAAVRAAARALEAGADALDVGGESTRPGAQRVPVDEQIRRVAPPIQAIRREFGDGPIISVDTTRAPVAHAALEAGADAINDVSGGLEDPELLALAAERGAGVVLMHRLTTPERDAYSHSYERAPAYPGGVTHAVDDALRDCLARATRAGVAREAVALDPGLGFGKTVQQNAELIVATTRLLDIGRPLLCALSRKSFTATLSGMDPGRDPAERDAASIGLMAVAARLGARLFRVHDVAPARDAVAAACALGGPAGGV